LAGHGEVATVVIQEKILQQPETRTGHEDRMKRVRPKTGFRQDVVDHGVVHRVAPGFSW